MALACGCSLHTPQIDAPYRFRCESGNDCIDGFYCVAGYCSEGFLSAGRRHTCMLRSDGTAACWGAGAVDAGVGVHRGQSDPLPDRFIDIAAGGFHTCGLKPNGRVKCWGHPEAVQTTPRDLRFRQISAGLAHTCGITTDGHVTCWGAGLTSDDCRYEGYQCGQADPPSHVQGREYIEVAAGDYHTCVRTAMKTVECWGAGSPGTVATAGSHHHDQGNRPGTMGLIDTVLQLSAGGFHTCAAVTRTVATDTRLGCWGAGLPFIATPPHYGQSTPVEGEYARVAAGGLHTCGLDPDGWLTCWGAGTTIGACTEDITECGQADPPISEDIRFISAGHAHTCIIELDGGVACWGAGETVGSCDEWFYECGQSLPPDDLY